MPKFNPYLNFPGNTEEAFNFYKSVFGGEFAVVVRYSDTGEAAKLSDDNKNKLMHIALPLSDGTTLMATDVVEGMGQKLIEGTNFSLSIHVDSRAEADTIFSKLSAGGKVAVPMADTFWGDYWGMFTDKFNIQWMISFNTGKPQQ